MGAAPFGNGERWLRAVLDKMDPGANSSEFLIDFLGLSVILPDELNVYPKEGINSAVPLLHMGTDKRLFIDSEAGGRCL